MKKLIKSYLNNWYNPVLVIVGSGVLGLFTIQFPNEIILYFGIALPIIAILVSVGLGILRLFKKDYRKGLLQTGFTALVSIIGFFIISFYLALYPYDFYADNLEIPDDIEIHDPLGKEWSEVVIEKSAENNNEITDGPESIDFELKNSFQPGLYYLDVWLTQIDSGQIYLKAFEVTQNDPLSVPLLKMRSSMEVINPTDSIRKFSLSKHFTIYEGDWGTPYAARFELWYKANRSNQDTLLVTKNYKIEGWQR